MRPKKTESQRLTKTVLFRLTELEEAQLKRTAAQCGMSVSDYCRAAIFGTTPKQRLTPEQQKLLEEAVKSAGTCHGSPTIGAAETGRMSGWSLTG